MPWLRTPQVPEGFGHVWQSYVLSVDEAAAGVSRNRIMEALQERGIATRPGTHAVHMLGAYRRLYGLQPDDYPVARDCDRYSMAIPMHNRLSEADVAHIVDSLKQLG